LAAPERARLPNGAARTRRSFGLPPKVTDLVERRRSPAERTLTIPIVAPDQIWSSITADAVARALDGRFSVAEDRGVDGRVLLPAAPVPVRDILVEALRTVLAERGERNAETLSEDAGSRLQNEETREILAQVVAFGTFYVGFVAGEDIGYEGYRAFRLADRGYFYAIPRADAPAEVVPVVIGAWEPIDARLAFTTAAQRAPDPLNERGRDPNRRRSADILRALPEIRDDPAWEEMKQQQRVERIEDAHPMMLSSLVFEVLKRSLAEDRQDVVARGFVLVEAQLQGSTMERTMAEVALGQMFQAGFGDRAERYLGPRSRALLDASRSASAFWQPVVERLNLLYSGVRELVVQAYPWIHAEAGYRLDELGRGFNHELWFEHDPDGWSYPPDLTLSFSCNEVNEGTSRTLSFRIHARSEEVASLPPQALPNDLTTEQARASVDRYIGEVESVAHEKMDRIVSELEAVPSVREMRRYREYLEIKPDEVDASMGDDAWASAMTGAFRSSEHPAWKLVRGRVAEEGVDPRLCAIADLLPDLSGENEGDHGVLVAPGGRVFGFTVTVLERRHGLLDAHIVEWREFVNQGPLYAHRDAIERGRALLGADRR